MVAEDRSFNLMTRSRSLIATTIERIILALGLSAVTISFLCVIEGMVVAFSIKPRKSQIRSLTNGCRIGFRVQDAWVLVKLCSAQLLHLLLASKDQDAGSANLQVIPCPNHNPLTIAIRTVSINEKASSGRKSAHYCRTV